MKALELFSLVILAVSFTFETAAAVIFKIKTERRKKTWMVTKDE